MFQLNESSMKRIMREEYMKRLKQFLAEEIDIEYGKGADKINLIDSAKGLKVRHESGLEYTVFDYDEAAGNVTLLLPDESRLSEPSPSTSKLVEADLDGDGIADELDTDIDVMKQTLINDPVAQNRRKVTNDKLNLVNYQSGSQGNDKKNTNKNYIIVPVEKFVKEYSL